MKPAAAAAAAAAAVSMYGRHGPAASERRAKYPGLIS